MLLALLGATAGQGVVWYTGQFYALFFLQITLRVDVVTTYTLIGSALLLGTPFFIFFGWLSDRIGRRGIILAGCLLAAATYMPLFQALTQHVNPALAAYQQSHPITVAAKDCSFHLFVGPWSTFSDCDKAKDFLARNGLSFTSTDLPADAADAVVTRIGNLEIRGWDEASYMAVLQAGGYPSGGAVRERIDWGVTIAILFVLVLYVTMVYGPIAAFLVEMFPARIRYSSMSLPYHIGNGWFGGIVPLLATALVALKGDIYYGLWYPVIVAGTTFVIGLLFLRDRKDVDLNK